MARMHDWPASPQSLEHARAVLRASVDGACVIASDRDVDGLAAAVLSRRAMERRGAADVVIVPAARGEHVHHPAMQARLGTRTPTLLIVVDMGSRGAAILPGVPTVVIDHHQPHGLPPGAVTVSAFGHEPVAATSLLAFEVFRPLAPIEDLAWLAVLGTVADLGVDAPFPVVRDWIARHGTRDVSEAIGLLNAARRAAGDEVMTALDVLERAADARSIARGRVPGVDRLRTARRAVADETRRCARTRPLFAGRFALLRCHSPMQVHPLVAVRWMRRLKGFIVIAANDGYLPNRVNFAMRTTADVNMVEVLRGLRLGAVDGEYGFGHPAATGGSLGVRDFDRFLDALGFTNTNAPDRPVGVSTMSPRTATRRTTPTPAGAPATDIAGIAVSNAAKLWWPEERITKLDIVRHYERVAPRLGSFLADRPLTAERCPDGMRGRCFYQKNFVGPASRPLRTHPIHAPSAGRTVHYAIGGDLRTLLTLVNLGMLAVHLMNCRVASLRRPDWLAFDLDPWERFADAIPVALVLRDVLADLGLRGYPKTTGGKGLHVLVPLRPGPSHDDVLACARTVGAQVAARIPKRATTEFTRARRGDRLYLDAGRNTFGATIVAPYAVRRRPGAPVSTPLAWEEIDPRLDPTRFNFHTIERRLDDADPWARFWDDAQMLPSPARAA